MLSNETRLSNVKNYINKISEEKNCNDVNIFPAVDKNDISKLEMLKKEYNCTMHGGHAGCALSHMLIMESFLKTDNMYQIILEDDFKVIKPLPNNISEIEELCKQIKVNPNELDILYLSGRVNRDRIYRICNGCGTEGYILTRHGAKKIFELLKNGCDAPIDLKMQAHFEKARKSGWLRDFRSDNNVIVNAYRTKEIYVGINEYPSSIS
jgi:GR25 family glycosyltransferase involved in LPS biosynthesis